MPDHEAASRNCYVINSDADAVAFLRKNGLKATGGRIAILRMLPSNPAGALRVDQIYRALLQSGPSKIGTIYRTLGEFERLGFVDKEWDDGDLMTKACYFLKPRQAAPAEYLVVCRACGERFTLADKQFSKLLYRLALAGGFELQLDSMTIEVSCNACAQSKGQVRPRAA